MMASLLERQLRASIREIDADTAERVADLLCRTLSAPTIDRLLAIMLRRHATRIESSADAAQ